MPNSNTSQDSWVKRHSGIIRSRDENDYRTPFARDECRVVHSFGFRRLQGKTQILGPEQGDYHRNRMTHSIEVASISRGIALYLKRTNSNKPIQDIFKGYDNDYDHLITSVSLLHDIGHPPFGHGGEVALNFKMRESSGFEGNAQTIRLLTKLETFTGKYGLDLTRRSLLGLLKYPASYSSLCAGYKNDPPYQNRKINIDDWKPPKCYYDEDEEDVIKWILGNLSSNDKHEFSKFKNSDGKNKHKQTQYKSFDCSIMNLADDIAYSIHDIEDAIYFGLLTEKSFNEAVSEETLNFFNHGYTPHRRWEEDLFNKSEEKKVFGHLIHKLITSIAIREQDIFNCPLLRYSPTLSDEAEAVIENLKNIILNQVIKSQEVQTVVFGGMFTVMQLFDALESNHEKLLPNDYKEKIQDSTNTTLQRHVCDYIAGMTDNYARRLHMRIYGDTPRSVFEKL